MRKVLQIIPVLRPGFPAAYAQSDRLGKPAAGDERIAGHDPKSGRFHVLDERRAGPRLRYRHPDVEAKRIMAIGILRQMSLTSFCRALVSARMKRSSESAVPSSIQRVASATVNGETITVAARNAASNGHVERVSGTMT